MHEISGKALNQDATSAHAEADAPERHHILIVDDDQRTARALSSVLKRAGYRTTVFHSGNDAIRGMDGGKFAAALVDVHLPDLNGLVLVKALRERLGEKTPILVVSGDTSMKTLNSLPHVGATYFIAKPMSASSVLERLGQYLG